MGFRFSKSIKLGGGVRLNLSRRGVGTSFGVKGLRYSVGPRGHRIRASIPGSGLSYETRLGGGRKAKAARTKSPATGRAVKKPPVVHSRPAQQTSASPTLVRQQPKPGWLAPTAEKRFYRGLEAFRRGDYKGALSELEQASAKDQRNIADDFLAGYSALVTGDQAKAISYLEKVVQSEIALPDAWMQKYNVDVTLTVNVTTDVTVQAAFDSIGAALLLAEIYQQNGQLDDAIGVLEELHEAASDDPILRLSLVDLYTARGLDEGVIEVGQGVQNADDVTLQTILYYAGALTRRGLFQAGLEVLTAALRRKSGRNPTLINAALYERAKIHVETGQAAKARKDFEKIYAAAPKFADVAQRLGIA